MAARAAGRLSPPDRILCVVPQEPAGGHNTERTRHQTGPLRASPALGKAHRQRRQPGAGRDCLQPLPRGRGPRRQPLHQGPYRHDPSPADQGPGPEPPLAPAASGSDHRRDGYGSKPGNGSARPSTPHREQRRPSITRSQDANKEPEWNTTGSEAGCPPRPGRESRSCLDRSPQPTADPVPGFSHRGRHRHSRPSSIPKGLLKLLSALP